VIWAVDADERCIHTYTRTHTYAPARCVIYADRDRDLLWALVLGSAAKRLSLAQLALRLADRQSRTLVPLHNSHAHAATGAPLRARPASSKQAPTPARPGPFALCPLLCSLAAESLRAREPFCVHNYHFPPSRLCKPPAQHSPLASCLSVC